MSKYLEVVEEIRKILSDNLERLMEERGYTQEKFAERTNSAQAYVSQVMCGKRWPKPATIKKFADALGVAEHQLFERKFTDSDKIVTAEQIGHLKQSLVQLLRLGDELGLFDGYEEFAAEQEKKPTKKTG